jgi:hypothetical protein
MEVKLYSTVYNMTTPFTCTHAKMQYNFILTSISCYIPTVHFMCCKDAERNLKT